MENCLPFTDDVMVVLVHKFEQQTHLLALHLEILGLIPRLLNALNGLGYFSPLFYYIYATNLINQIIWEKEYSLIKFIILH